MPAYLYQCLECLHRDTRIGRVDDHAAICDRCGHPMLRIDQDVFAPYFDYREAEFRWRIPESAENGASQALPKSRPLV